MDLHLSQAAKLPAALIGSTDQPAGGGIFSIAILLLIPLGMYFLLIRPQRKRRNEQVALQKSIGVGDEVMTTAGIYGFVTAMEEGSDVVWLEIDNDVQIRVTRAAIANKVNTTGATAKDDAAKDDASTDEAAPAAPAAPAASKTPTLKGGSDRTTSTDAESNPE